MVVAVIPMKIVVMSMMAVMMVVGRSCDVNNDGGE